MSLITLILTILLPPVGVAMKHGIDKTALLNLVLTILGFIPGLIHGLYVNYAR
ncbi:YqaE/Pmp3 family membrane protein [Pontixanthobacter aestiaquae]|uniref:YqaE/Pmp3 family membrane protein n=1 Tax=Pontixanthobacter aestiaquae TaxID=1509367 RepID=A0A844ZAS4_9SPHN|nr:YqaE/Pmp3 family membrane protein [Pontixanthobacter aestiaquae]MDN3644696.1 YqaE/Pmp3 family membrane protein [Pontixanthobacter aestiaquae]MXO84296.1 YqaE/Pmp3 family membrane protein [Pontixanthobacter aestiaquae]